LFNPLQADNLPRDQNFRIRTMATSASFSSTTGVLSEFGDAANNFLFAGRDLPHEFL
jgi:hypothetical protein